MTGSRHAGAAIGTVAPVAPGVPSAPGRACGPVRACGAPWYPRRSLRLRPLRRCRSCSCRTRCTHGPPGPIGSVAPFAPSALSLRRAVCAGWLLIANLFAPTGPLGPIGPVTPFAPVCARLPLSHPPGHSAPIGPVAPFAPSAPVAPFAPFAPVAPVAPVAPTRPLGPPRLSRRSRPSTPVAPTEPVGPVGPLDPVAPIAPVAPVVPVAPFTPVAPVDPCAPALPLHTSVVAVTSDVSSLPLPFWSSPNAMLEPPALHWLPGLTGVTLTAAFRPFRLVWYPGFSCCRDRHRTWNRSTRNRHHHPGWTAGRQTRSGQRELHRVVSADEGAPDVFWPEHAAAPASNAITANTA